MTAVQHVASAESLEAALSSLPEGGTIELAAGTYAVNLVLDRGVTLRGVGEVVLDGRGRSQVIAVNAESKVRLEHVAITNGAGPVAAVAALGTPNLELVDVVVRGNRAGGSVVQLQGGTLLVDRCHFENNDGDFGAVLLVSGAAHATVRNSTVKGNRGRTSVVAVHDLGQLALEGTTIADNEAPIAVEVRGTPDRLPKLTVRDSTIAGAPTAIGNGPRLPGTATVERSKITGALQGEVSVR